MASVKNKDTKVEVRVRKELFKRGFRYKINDKSLPGSPDVVFPKYRTVVFVHGCYWHGHKDCFKAIKPNSNIHFWSEKIRKNQFRDGKVQVELVNLGWQVIVVWECELRNIPAIKACIDELGIRLISNLVIMADKSEYCQSCSKR